MAVSLAVQLYLQADCRCHSCGNRKRKPRIEALKPVKIELRFASFAAIPPACFSH
jgi:hypothetical protein